MKRVLKWAGYGLAAVMVFVLFVIAGAFAASEMMIRWPAGGEAVTMISAKAGSAERGKRIAKLNGCHDCHGEGLEGRLFHDEMPILRAWGPNLTRIAAAQSDAELDRAIRRGVAGDGRRLWVMPSFALSQLSDQDAADLIAYVRSFPVTGDDQPRLQVGHLGRLGVLLGKFDSEAAMLAKAGPPVLPDYGPRHAEGRAIAELCVECHGADLKGVALLKTPDLTMAASYDRADFTRLLHEGVAAGDRKLEGLMGGVARSRFSALTEAEVAALHDYLNVRAEREIAAAQ